MEHEATLLARAKAGDAEALAELIQDHKDTVYRVALRMCGNPTDAEETLQETFVSALEALPRFEGRAKLSTWLYRIASNECLLQRRRSARLPVTLPVHATEALPDRLPQYFVDLSQQPDAVLLDEELAAVLSAAIRELSPALRLVFIWRDLEGLSTTDTAKVLGISESAVKVRLHRARLQLRRTLAAYLVDPEDDPRAPSSA